MSFELEDPGNETNQTINETLNETATAVNETAANGSQSPAEFWSFLGDPIIMIPTAIFAFLVIGATVGIWYYQRKKNTEPIFEKEKLQDIVKPGLKDLLNLGKANNSVLRRDLRTEGKVHRDYRISEKHEMLHEDSKKKDIDIVDTDHEAFNQMIEDLKKDGVISDQVAEKLEKDEIVPHRLIEVKPVNRLKKVLWILTDFLLSMDKFTDYYLVPEMGMIDNGADESISIDRNLQFRPFAGIYVPMTYSSMSIISSAVFRHLYEISLEDQSNYHKQVNEFASQFSQEMQKLERKVELEQQARNNGTVGKMNNS